jgi:hypothetical protein
MPQGLRGRRIRRLGVRRWGDRQPRHISRLEQGLKSRRSDRLRPAPCAHQSPSRRLTVSRISSSVLVLLVLVTCRAWYQITSAPSPFSTCSQPATISR